jgi:hypothetical protein
MMGCPADQKWVTWSPNLEVRIAVLVGDDWYEST